MKETFKFNIFGSCVSRDLLEFRKDNFTVSEYIARESIISFLSNPVCFDESKIELSSSFQKKQLIQDLRKSGMEILKKNPADYLIIDLIEERFDIAKIGSSFLTMSNEFNISHVFSEKDFKKCKKYLWLDRAFFRGIDMRYYLQVFVKEMRKIYPPERIIIHKVFYSHQYIGLDNMVHDFPPNYYFPTLKINRILKYLYNCLENELPTSLLLDISKKYMASENHKWGLAPMHYQTEYYEEAANTIIAYLNTLQK